MHRYWNHNTHYHHALLRLLPTGCDRAVDVGCGDGLFAQRLAAVVRTVVALDADPAEVRKAEARREGEGNLVVVQADAMLMPFPSASFDVVSSLAVIHHLPMERALTEMTRILRPGGRLVVLGVWPDAASLLDRVISLVAVVVNRAFILRWGPGTVMSPTQEPTMSLRDARRLLQRLLPGAEVSRRLLWRYTLTWTKPYADRQP
ncbi:MAG TPA: class I SAM-dependent methyltransferase [Acidimicrobiales bacterium]|nr:class I SAM-dependent methyltransferase [Acidimicrobiales bacterium]